MKKLTCLWAAMAIMLGLAGTAFGLMTSDVGPDRRGYDPNLPPLEALMRHPTRVYTRWCNGQENFYYWAGAKEVNELLARFAKADMEEYDVWIRSEDGKTETLLEVDEHVVWIQSGRGQEDGDQQIHFNVDFFLPSGLYLWHVREQKEWENARPHLTIYLEHGQVSWNQLEIPENVVVKDAGEIKIIGARRRSEIKPFALDRMVDINLFYPVLTDISRHKSYPVAIETVQFKRVGENLHCFIKAVESSTTVELAVSVEVFGASGEGKKTAEMRGVKTYDLDFGPMDDFTGARNFAVIIERMEPWGGPVNGVQVRLTADEQLFNQDETVCLHADIRNKGAKEFLIAQHESSFEAAINGRWYRCQGGADLKSSPLGPGREYRDIPIALDETQWISVQDEQPLVLRPGSHNIRARVVLRDIGRYKVVSRVESNTVSVWVEEKVKIERKVFYGRALFEDATPAVLSTGPDTYIVKWDEGIAKHEKIGKVEREGCFSVGIPDEDVKQLKSGKSWVAVSIGGHTVEDNIHTERFSFDLLTSERDKPGAVKISRPPAYYGRILYEDGTPAVLDPIPWPEARIWVEFSTGESDVDSEGYFRVYLTQKQRKKLEAGELDDRGRVYFPSYEERGRSGSVARFPARLLSPDKYRAGVVKITKPVYKPTFDLTKAPSLVGKPLPGFDGIKTKFAPESAEGKNILVCFWDMNQRPSRHCIRELAKRADQLKEKGISIVAIQASKVDEEALNKWVEKYKITLPLGMVEDEAERIRFNWGAKSLPWLILTDRKHVVTSEGFGLEELDRKVGVRSAQDTDEQDIISKMRSLDEAFLQAHTIVVHTQTPARSWGRQHERGQKLTKITLTSCEGSIAVDREISYTDVPAYRRGTGIDYRPDGRLIVWRHTRERSLIESDFQGIQRELTCLLISPDGKITRHRGGPSFDFYRPSDTKIYRWFWTPIWATGRGFANSLSKVTEVHQAKDGLISFSASGFLNPRIPGTWQMAVDPNVGYLVRSASFTASGGSKPSFACTTSGTKWFDTCSLAERANMGRLYGTIVTEQYKPAADMELLDEVRRILRGSLPKGAAVYDWRPNPDRVFAYPVGEHTMSEEDILDAVGGASYAPSLVGKSLPELKPLGVALKAADVNDKMVLVCFFDINQRPSRRMVRELSKRAEEIRGKGVVIVAVQASRVDRKELDEWVKKYEISFPVGMLEGDEKKIRFRWGAKALPWLILTDRQHIVRAEGFSLTELNKRIKATTENLR